MTALVKEIKFQRTALATSRILLYTSKPEQGESDDEGGMEIFEFENVD